MTTLSSLVAAVWDKMSFASICNFGFWCGRVYSCEIMVCSGEESNSVARLVQNTIRRVVQQPNHHNKRIKIPVDVILFDICLLC